MADEVVIEVWRAHGGGIQLSISKLDAEGNGGGYRIAGPKFCACHESELLVKHVLDKRDATEILRYASAVI